MSPLIKDKESLGLICPGRVLWAVNRSKVLTENSRNLYFWSSVTLFKEHIVVGRTIRFNPG